MAVIGDGSPAAPGQVVLQDSPAQGHSLQDSAARDPSQGDSAARSVLSILRNVSLENGNSFHTSNVGEFDSALSASNAPMEQIMDAYSSYDTCQNFTNSPLCKNDTGEVSNKSDFTFNFKFKKIFMFNLNKICLHIVYF